MHELRFEAASNEHTALDLHRRASCIIYTGGVMYTDAMTASLLTHFNWSNDSFMQRSTKTFRLEQSIYVDCAPMSCKSSERSLQCAFPILHRLK